METYGIERGDVLLSLQMMLTREEEQPGTRPAAQRSPLSVAAPASALPSGLRSQMEGMVPTIRKEAPDRQTAGLSRMPPAPSRPVIMVDPDTGAGSLQALRRDLRMARAWDEGPTSAVVAVKVQGMDQIRMVLGPQSVEEVMKGLVEVAPFTLGARDRVYRSARDQLVLLLAGADDEAVEATRNRLEEALRRFLSDRGFPEVSLDARRIDPAALAG